MKKLIEEHGLDGMDKLDVIFHMQRKFDEDVAKKVLSQDEITILVTLTAGQASCSCWGCDLTYDYVKINGDYRS